MKIFSIPNLLTLFRLILVPFAVYNIYISNFYTALFLIFIAVLTDGLDGFIARKFNQITEIGKIIDPLADNLLVISGIVVIQLNKDIHFNIFLFFLILFRELYVLFGSIYLTAKCNSFKISPTFLGKATAFAEFLMLILVLLEKVFDKVAFLKMLSIYFVIVMVSLSLIQYTLIGVRALRSKD
jgi:CDP-diacylglycerol--glycerol-3-phosphate 3-phosphatidyltransferase